METFTIQVNLKDAPALNEMISRLERIENILVGKAIDSKVSRKRVLTLEEAVKYTGFSKPYMYKLTHMRKIPHYKPTGKLIMFDLDELEKWLLQNRIKTNEEIDMKATEYVTKHSRR